jgi:hypothetical protein
LVAERAVSFQITVLKVLAGHPGGHASLVDLRRAVEILISSGPDWTNRMKRLAARAPDLDIFSQSFVLREDAGWQITDAGRALLSSVEAPAPVTAVGETAQENNDAFFMRDLYALFWKHVMPLNPRRVVDESGKKYGVIILELLWIEKVLQIVFRLRGLGIGDAATTLDFINELHLLTRLREESVAHLQGTCVSSDDVLFS